MLRWSVLHLTVIEEQLLSWDQKEQSQVHTAGALDSVYFTGFFFSAHFPWVCSCAGQSGFRSEPWEGISDRHSGYQLSVFYKNFSWSHKDLHFFLVAYKMFDVVTKNHRSRGKAKEFAISQLIQTVSIGCCVGLRGRESCGYD